MTPRTWFALVLRYLGASSVLSATSYAVTAYNVQKGLYTGITTTLGAVNHAVVEGVLGVALLFFADRIAAHFVPARRPPVRDGDSQVGGEHVE